MGQNILIVEYVAVGMAVQWNVIELKQEDVLTIDTTESSTVDSCRESDRPVNHWIYLHNERVPVFISVPPTYTASVHWNMTERQKAGWCADMVTHWMCLHNERVPIQCWYPTYSICAMEHDREGRLLMLRRIEERRPTWKSERNLFIQSRIKYAAFHIPHICHIWQNMELISIFWLRAGNQWIKCCTESGKGGRRGEAGEA